MQVQDLHYGDVLFHYWADEDSGLEALTRLEAYTHWGLHAAPRRRRAAAGGGLYLQLGMHNEAGTALRGAAERRRAGRRCATAPGSTWRRSGTSAATTTAASRRSAASRASSRRELEAERTNLLVNVLMRQERYDDAIARLQELARAGRTGWPTRASTWASRWCAPDGCRRPIRSSPRSARCRPAATSC